MGTRSTTYVISGNDNKTPLVCIYGQFDGSPENFGQQLYNFLVNREVVNGFHLPNVTVSNGMDDLAAQLICYLKNNKYNTTGGVYIYPLRALPEKNQSFQRYANECLLPYAFSLQSDFVYIIKLSEESNTELEIQVYSWIEMLLYKGSIRGMAENFHLCTNKALSKFDKDFLSR